MAIERNEGNEYGILGDKDEVVLRRTSRADEDTFCKRPKGPPKG